MVTQNYLVTNIHTKELIVDYRRKSTDIQHLYINRDCVERVVAFEFLGINIAEDLSWGANSTALVKKAQRRLFC